MIDDADVSAFGSNDKVIPDNLGAAELRRVVHSGSTCDAFEGFVQRRHVFVKRLKEEYRDSPLHRAAFDKEYELGVGMTHVSLPRYLSFGGDHIVMEYVEGDTLASLIHRHDPRLGDRRFVRRLLLELLDVIDYLHRRGIVHCDIKADNIIISPYDDRPVTLIDFDKAYSRRIPSAYGNPAKFGLDSCEDGMIDLRGLGKIAAALGEKRFAQSCFSNAASVDYLRRRLDSRRRTKRMLAILAGTLLLIGVGLFFILRDSRHSEPYVMPEVTSESNDSSQPQDIESQSFSIETETTAQNTQPQATPPIAQQAQTASGNGVTKWMDARMAVYADSISALQRQLRQALTDKSLSSKEISRAFLNYYDRNTTIERDLMTEAIKTFPEMSPDELRVIIISHPQYRAIEATRRELDAIGKERRSGN